MSPRQTDDFLRVNGAAEPGMFRDSYAEDRMWANQLRARHGDLITRYVSRRITDPRHSSQIVDSVFASAAASRAVIQGPALPWLISAARSECARTRYTPQKRAIRRAG